MCSYEDSMRRTDHAAPLGRLATYVEKQVRFASCLIMACLVDKDKVTTRLPKIMAKRNYALHLSTADLYPVGKVGVFELAV